MSRSANYDLIKYDWWLLGATVLLTVFGLAALYSTSLAGIVATQSVVAPQPNFTVFWKQVWFAIAGLALVVVLPFFDYQVLTRISRMLIVISAALLLAVLFFGTTIRGTTGWFGIAGFGVQPVEAVKLFLVIFLAKYFSDYAGKERGLQHVFISGAVVAVLVGLVMLQPDFGSAFLMLVIWGSLVLVSGIRRLHILIGVLSVLVVMVLAWFVILQPYQKDRVTSFLSPASDPLGRGYNVTQSVIAIGSGGWTGKGLGYGSQSQLRFLPERQTDFIFAVIAEELGFVGVLVLCSLFAVVIWRSYRLMNAVQDDFSVYLVLGITVSIAIEAFVNLSGNLRLLPVTGVTLPFVSYGGSSLLMKFIMVGVLQSVAMRSR